MVEAQRTLRDDSLSRGTWLMSCSLPRRCNVQVPAGPVRDRREEPDQVDVRIGITQTPRELEVELKDDADPEKVVAEIEKLLKSGDGVLWLTDRKGRRVA